MEYRQILLPTSVISSSDVYANPTEDLAIGHARIINDLPEHFIQDQDTNTLQRICNNPSSSQSLLAQNRPRRAELGGGYAWRSALRMLGSQQLVPCLTSSTDLLSPNGNGAPTALRYLNPMKPAFDGDLACRMLYDPSQPVRIKLTSIGRQHLHDRAMSIHQLSESMGRAKLSVASWARANARFLV